MYDNNFLNLNFFQKGLITVTVEVVVAQLVERSLPIPEVRGSNPVIGKNLYRTFTVNCIEKTKIKKKRPGMAHFFNSDSRIKI